MLRKLGVMLLVVSGTFWPAEASRNPWVEDRHCFADQTIHFPSRQSALDAHAQQSIAIVAAYLAAHSKSRVEIEGHCDRRGTEEYNRILGEARAMAAKEALIRLGVDAERIYTISFGEDRPAASGWSFRSFSRNRRVEFLLLTPAF